MLGRILIPVLVIAPLLALPVALGRDRDAHHLVRVEIPTIEKGLALQRLGLDLVAAQPGGSAHLIARDGDLATLEAAGFRPETVIRNLETFYADRLRSDPAASSRAWPDGSMGGYFTNSEVEAELDAWSAAYPHIMTQKQSIGTTVEGRDIWAVKISDNPGVDENEPEVCFDSLIHPREVMSLMTILYFMKNLLEGYGTNPELTYLVDHREIWFIPIHNPDGHVYNESTNPKGGGMWRKNRRHNGGGVYGVDLARNYGYRWGYDNVGSSPNPGNIGYRGPGPFSEPEAQAVRDFLTARPIVAGWNTHTFTNVYICPFSYDQVLPYGNDWPLYQEYMKDISAENGYPGGPSPDTLGYYANGTPLDWQYHDQGILVLAPEIGTWDDGFWPPKSRIVPLAEENQLATTYWAWIGGSYARLVDHTFADDNKDGLFHPGEPVDVALVVRNKGLASTATNVTATLKAVGPFVTITQPTHDFGILASATDGNNASSPLAFVIDPTTPYGQEITLEVDLAFDGYVLTEHLRFTCGVPEILYALDMETDPGWTVGDTGDNATTGIWVRSDPFGHDAGTIPLQPEDDHTAAPGTRCFVTGNGSTQPDVDDVDNGKTTLKTGLFDLAGRNKAQVSYWRWYADLGAFHSNNDLFLVDISNDGGSTWTNVEILDHTKNYWHEARFTVSDFVTPTRQMRMRFIARDEPDDSLCEALIDDFMIKTYETPLKLTLVGTPKIGTTVNITLDAPKDGGHPYLVVAALGTYPPILLGNRIFPLTYDFFLLYSLNPANGIFFNFAGLLDGAGHSGAPSFVIPNLKSLVGQTIHFAGVTVDPAQPGEVTSISAPLPVVIED